MFHDKAWKVRKKYLGKATAELLRCPKEELQERLKRLETKSLLDIVDLKVR